MHGMVPAFSFDLLIQSNNDGLKQAWQVSILGSTKQPSNLFRLVHTLVNTCHLDAHKTWMIICHETIPLQAISQIPDSTSRESRITSPPHALPSLPHMRVNPRTFPQIPCTIPKIPCYPTYLSARLPLSGRVNSRFCVQQLHKLRAFDTQLLNHRSHLSLSAYPCYLARSSDIDGTRRDRNSGA